MQLHGMDADGLAEDQGPALADVFSSSAEGDDEYPNNPLDESVFGPAWRAEIEKLDTLTPAEIVAEASGDGFLPTDWAMDHASILEALSALGMDDRRLRLQRGDELSLVAQVLAYLGLEPEPLQVQWHKQKLAARILELNLMEPLAKRLRGDHLPPTLQDLWQNQRPQLKETVSAKPTVQELLDALPVKGTRRQRPPQNQTLPATREAAERAEQLYWGREFLALMRLADAPVIETVADSLDPVAALLGAMGATRGSTMKSYHRALVPFRKWLETSMGTQWPSGPIPAVDFLHMAGSKPCAPTFPQRFLQALAWFEKAGGWRGQGRISEQQLFTNTVKFWQEELRNGVEPLKQAPRLPWIIVAALELYTCNTEVPDKLRLKAFTLLLKCWGTLREDDVQHISPSRLRIMGELLVTELLRTKTTGASKRTRQLPMAIWLGATITRSMWLESGLGLLELHTKKNADFLLPAWGKASEPTNTPMTYAESAGLSKKILADLTVPEFDEESHTWGPGTEKILDPGMDSFFTEHSGRPVLPTAAQCLEFAKEDRDHLGRWSPGGAEEYSRAYRMIVQAIQVKVRNAVLAGDKRLAEHEILDRLGTWGASRNWEEGKIAGCKTNLGKRFEKFWSEIAKTGGPPDDIDPISTASLPAPSLPRTSHKSKPTVPRFLIVYGRNRKTAKLHKIGGCPWTSIQLADSQEVSQAAPELYDSRCKQCWPRLLGQVEERDFRDTSSGSDF